MMILYVSGSEIGRRDVMHINDNDDAGIEGRGLANT